uniref:Uncharacterized protein n=1 Tax=Tanacetum cinerariifolium TaxID=118510 RepID=A0A699HJJ7_TANCI|nr:hypothetical protein [Tanacetum cinerariifolium]
MGIVPTEMKLIPKHTQQGISHEVSCKERSPLYTLGRNWVNTYAIRNTKLFSGIEDSHHVPSDAMHNPSQPLKVLIFVEDSWNEEPCSDVYQVGDEREVDVPRSFNWTPSELIMDDGVLPERGGPTTLEHVVSCIVGREAHCSTGFEERIVGYKLDPTSVE